MLIRPALEHDLPAVKAIYHHQVRTGISTFDVEPTGDRRASTNWPRFGFRRFRGQASAVR